MICRRTSSIEPHTVQGEHVLNGLQDSRFKESFEALGRLLDETESIVALARDLRLPVTIDLTDLRDQIRDPFSIFICGEFNSGKSSFINSLAGEKIAEIGVLPTTQEIHTLKTARIPGLLFIDSPGLNSIVEGHQQLTEKFLQRSDFVLFITSIERPLSESELRFLKVVRERWRRKVVVVLNKVDLLTTEEVAQVVAFVEKGVGESLGVPVTVFPISTRTSAGLDKLEKYLSEMFGEKERVNVKIAACLNTLRSHSTELQKSIAEKREAIKREDDTFLKVLKRSQSRFEEGQLIFEAYNERVLRSFTELVGRLDGLIDEHFGLFKVLKARISGNRENLKTAIVEIQEQMSFDRKLEEVLNDAAARTLLLKNMIQNEAEDFLSREDDQTSAMKIQSNNPSASELADQLRISIEKGLGKFLALGSAAAASGIGAKVATVASVEITSAILMVALAIFSFRALPEERKRIKRQILDSFTGMAHEFIKELKAGVSRNLEEALEVVRSALEPRREALRSEDARLEALASRVAGVLGSADTLENRLP